MLSGIVTLILIALFLGAWAWAWQPKRKPEFEAAARQPLEDLVHADDMHKEIRK
jgi:cytochrome c oxidase cbb3-type subunit IV